MTFSFYPLSNGFQYKMGNIIFTSMFTDSSEKIILTSLSRIIHSSWNFLLLISIVNRGIESYEEKTSILIENRYLSSTVFKKFFTKLITQFSS